MTRISSLYVAQLAQAAANSFHLGFSLRSAVEQHAQAPNLHRLLRARREGPGDRAAQEYDELAPSRVGHVPPSSCASRRP
jgi:hypothetical protein